MANIGEPLDGPSDCLSGPTDRLDQSKAAIQGPAPLQDDSSQGSSR